MFETYAVRVVVGGVKGVRDGAGRGAEFDGPAGLATGSNGEIYICDSNNGLIRIANLTRKHTTVAHSAARQWKVETWRTTNSMASSPRAVAFHPATGHVFVTDAQDSSLWMHIRNGRGRRLGPVGFFLGAPRGIALDSRARIIVADSNGRVLRLSELRDKWTVLASKGDRPVSAGVRRVSESRMGWLRLVGALKL